MRTYSFSPWTQATKVVFISLILPEGGWPVISFDCLHYNLCNQRRKTGAGTGASSRARFTCKLSFGPFIFRRFLVSRLSLARCNSQLCSHLVIHQWPAWHCRYLGLVESFIQDDFDWSCLIFQRVKARLQSRWAVSLDRGFYCTHAQEWMHDTCFSWWQVQQLGSELCESLEPFETGKKYGDGLQLMRWEFRPWEKMS